MPAAYIVAQVDVFNPEGFEPYRLKAPKTIQQYGGKYIVRGGGSRNWRATIRFPDKAVASAWYASDEYKGLIALRKICARTNMVIVEGVN